MKYFTVNLRPDDPDITLTAYIADETWRRRDAMLVIPGGGYGCICDDREGEPIALAFLARGVNSFVLKYSVGKKAVFPRPLIDASLAMSYIRNHADEFCIDPDRIFAVGFSAGGHLAASLGTFWHLPEVREGAGIGYGENRPAGTVLCYAVLSSGEKGHAGSFYNILGTDNPTKEMLDRWSVELHVDEKTSPAFFVHTADDRVVPVDNALVTASAMAAHNIQFELHIWPHGDHGIALANDLTSRGNPSHEDADEACWVDMACSWMKKVRSTAG